MPIEDELDKILKDESPSTLAVKSLIEADEKEGTPSVIELKTDLSADEVKIHSVLSVLNTALEMKKEDFTKRCILGSLINVKERKSLSKDRKSRLEIVQVAKQPEMPMLGMGGMPIDNQGFWKKMTTPRPK